MQAKSHIRTTTKHLPPNAAVHLKSEFSAWAHTQASQVGTIEYVDCELINNILPVLGALKSTDVYIKMFYNSCYISAFIYSPPSVLCLPPIALLSCGIFSQADFTSVGVLKLQPLLSYSASVVVTWQASDYLVHLSGCVRRLGLVLGSHQTRSVVVLLACLLWEREGQGDKEK